jgi:hypothetical protein
MVATQLDHGTRMASEPAPGWVVCLATVRSVRSGRVICPIATRPTAVTDCLRCHFLETIDEERASVTACGFSSRDG